MCMFAFGGVCVKFADKDPRIAKEPTVLFLGPYALGESVDAAARSWQKKIEVMLGRKSSS